MMDSVLAAVLAAVFSFGQDTGASSPIFWSYDATCYTDTGNVDLCDISDWIDLDSAQHRGAEWGIEAFVWRGRLDRRWRIMRCDSVMWR